MADWITLTKTRRQAWAAWLAGMLPALLLLVGQTVGGAWEGAVERAWVWLLSGLLPSFGLLLSSLLLNRKPRSMTPPGAHTALVGGTAVYGMLTLFSLVSASMFGAGELSAVERLEQAYWWLLPLQVVLLGGYYLVFFRGEAVFQPNEQLLRNAALKSASEAAQKGNPVQQACRNHLAAGEYEVTFALMNQHFQQGRSDDFNALLLLQNQHTLLLREREEGLVEPVQAQVRLNRITAALLNLTDQLTA